MPFFKSNNRDNTLADGIPHDGGFGHKNLRKYEGENPRRASTASTTTSVDQTNYPNNSDPSNNGHVMSGGSRRRGSQVGDDNEPRSNSQGGGGGGFISQSRADRLSREGELRRQEQQDQYGRIGTREEMDAMGFDSDSPPPESTELEKAMAARQRAVEHGAIVPAW